MLENKYSIHVFFFPHIFINFLLAQYYVHLIRMNILNFYGWFVGI